MKVRAWMAAAQAGRLSVCCMSSGRCSARLAAILALFGEVADEIVVAVEEPLALATHAALAQVADRVLAFPPAGPADRPIAWLFGACSGKWILNIDDDEVPSSRLIALLPELIGRDDITHAWIARRWLYPTEATYLDQAPWNNEFQLRLVLADARFVQFSDVFHRPVIAHGPGVFLDDPVWHLDTAVNPVTRRRAKAEAYERERPGMKIGGRAHNHSFYLPELVPDATLADVPADERLRIKNALVGEYVPTRASCAELSYASADEIDLAWPGTPFQGTLHRGRISIATMPNSMRAGVQETIDVFVTNESEQTWRWGKEARPEIRLAYQWSNDGQPVHEVAALRTALPSDLAPRTTQFLPVHVVAPRESARYSLQLQLMHEGVGPFASTAVAELEVRDRELLALIGEPAAVAELLAQLALPPCLEPVVVLGNDSDRSAYGDYLSVPGLRTPLLAGLESSGRLARTIKLPWRSLGIIRSARRYRRIGSTYDVRLASLFDLLQHSRALVVAGTDWPTDAAAGREWWRLLTTLLVCRAIGTAAAFADAAIPTGTNARDAVFRTIIHLCATPIDKITLEQPPVAPTETQPAEPQGLSD